jgi:hypothetical protein
MQLQRQPGDMRRVPSLVCFLHLQCQWGWHMSYCGCQCVMVSRPCWGRWPDFCLSLWTKESTVSWMFLLQERRSCPCAAVCPCQAVIRKFTYFDKAGKEIFVCENVGRHVGLSVDTRCYSMCLIPLWSHSLWIWRLQCKPKRQNGFTLESDSNPPNPESLIGHSARSYWQIRLQTALLSSGCTVILSGINSIDVSEERTGSIFRVEESRE